MPMNHSASFLSRLRRAVRLHATLLLTICGISAPGTASALECSVNGNPDLLFGTVRALSPTDAQNVLSYRCGSNTPPAYVRLCLYIPYGEVPGIAPRYMKRWDDSLLAFGIYTDAARTQLVGSQAGEYTEYSWTVQLQGQWYASYEGTMPLYGRVLAGQGTLPSGDYRNGISNVKLVYVEGNGGYPENCSSGVPRGSVDVYMNVTATVPSGCRITALSDLDFGSLPSPLSVSRDQTSSVSLQCPQGTAWQIGMGQGNHHSSTRRMGNGSGSYVTYELYRDASRTQVWGDQRDTNTVNGTGTTASVQIPIHGRIFSQGSVPSGSYTDTVIVTLTY